MPLERHSEKPLCDAIFITESLFPCPTLSDHVFPKVGIKPKMLLSVLDWK